MKTVATVLQITRGLLILTPAEYDKPEGGFAVKSRKSSSIPTTFNVPQIFELNDSLKDHPFEKTDEMAAFVKRCAESVSMELGDVFVCIEDEDVLITKEYKHAPAKEKLLPTFARVEAENVLHQEVDKYTILNFEYGQQYGKQNKSDEISASLFAMNTGMLTDIRASFEKEGIRVVKICPPIAGMLHTCKADVNSATRAIAVISMDFAATRLVVLHNGAPVFQQSFSSVLEDIAELFSLEFGMSKMGAIDLIRQEGLGVCNKCKSAGTRKQTMTMLDNAAGEILRNLRMVISTKRLDIDEIVLVDALAKLPNIANYCRQVGLSAPMENITRLFAGGSQPPVAAASAAEKGYDTTSFITLNGVLTMPSQEANLLMGEANILTAMKEKGSNKIGTYVAAGLGIALGIWIVATCGTWLSLEFRKNNDNAQLNDPRYDPAKKLIAEEATWKKKVADMESDLAMLPNTSLKTADQLTEFFTQVRDKVNSISSINLDNFNHSFTTTVTVKDYPSYIEFRDSVNEGGYFKVSDVVTLTYTNNGTSAQSMTAPVVITVTDSTIAKAAEDAAAAKEAEKNKEIPVSTKETTSEPSPDISVSSAPDDTASAAPESAA